MKIGAAAGQRRVSFCCGWLLLAGGIVMPVTGQSAPLYRCIGSLGEAVYTSMAAPYHGCRPLDAGRRRAPGSPPASFRGLTAGVWSRPEIIAAAAGSPDRVPLLPVRVAPSSPLTPAAAGSVLRIATSRAATPVRRGAVYRVRRDDDSIEYTNIAPVGVGQGRVVRLFTYIVTCVACNLESPIHWQSVPLQRATYAGPIEDASRQFGVDPALLRAVIHAESAFNPNALSLQGAQGLMQLMPRTASDMGVLDAFDVSQNIHGGARYLAQLLLQFHGDIRRAAAAYDAGAGAVMRYGGVPPYAETQVYVERVELLFHRYRAHFETAVD